LKAWNGTLRSRLFSCDLGPTTTPVAKLVQKPSVFTLARVEQLSQLFRLTTQPPERLQAFTDLDIRAMLLDNSEAATQTVEDNCSTLSSKTSAAPKLGMRIDDSVGLRSVLWTVPRLCLDGELFGDVKRIGLRKFSPEMPWHPSPASGTCSFLISLFGRFPHGVPLPK